MAWEAWAALAVVAGVLYALARNLADPDVVLMGAVATVVSLSVVSDRFPTPAQAAAIVGNEGLLSVGLLFVVAAGLTGTGALRVVSDHVLGRPRSTRTAQARLMLPVVGISAILNNTPVVAMLIPVVREWCRVTRLSPTHFFIPLSYAAVLGGMCTLIGTSTNLVVQGLLIEARRSDPTVPVFSFFTLTPVGLPIALAGTAAIILLGGRLLPDRPATGTATERSREYMVEMAVEAGSPIDGIAIEAAGLRQLPGLFLAALERHGLRRVAVPADEVLRGGDRLTFVGVVDSVVHLHRIRGLMPGEQVTKLTAPRHTRLLIEAVVSTENPLVGLSIRDGRFRSRYEAAVVAVHRHGEFVQGRLGDIVLRAGDTLLLESSGEFLRQQGNSRDFFLVSPLPNSQPPRHNRAWLALAIMALMVVAMASEPITGVSTLHAALVSAALMGLGRCFSVEQARSSVDWSMLVTIGAALVLGRAVETSGLAGMAAGNLVEVLRPFGPTAVLAGIYLITLVFTELVTNNAAAALAFPIALATARSLDTNLMPFAVTVAIAASAGFATPIGYQTHLMVYGVGGYRFIDFVRIGVPVDILVLGLTVLLTPLIFPF